MKDLLEQARHAEAEVLQREEDLAGSQTRSSTAQAAGELAEARKRVDNLNERLDAAQRSQRDADRRMDDAVEARRHAEEDKGKAEEAKNQALVEKKNAEKRWVKEKNRLKRKNQQLESSYKTVVMRLCQVDSNGESNSFPVRFPCIKGFRTDMTGRDDPRVRELINTTWSNVGRVIADAAKELHYNKAGLRAETAIIMGVVGTRNVSVNAYLNRLQIGNHKTQKTQMQGIFKVIHNIQGRRASTGTAISLHLPYWQRVNQFLSARDRTRHLLLTQVPDIEGAGYMQRGIRHTETVITDYFLH